MILRWSGDGACLSLAPMLLLLGCSLAMSRPVPVETPCPDTPNCVSSLATDALHGVAPLRLVGPADGAVDRLAAVVLAFPRTELVEKTADTLSVTFTSRLFRWVDDVSFRVDPAAGLIQVRSASRVGRGDLGVNRKRVEAVRAAWAAAG